MVNIIYTSHIIPLSKYKATVIKIHYQYSVSLYIYNKLYRSFYFYFKISTNVLIIFELIKNFRVLLFFYVYNIKSLKDINIICRIQNIKNNYR